MNSRCHYEMAFERYLDERGIAYVPVEAVTAQRRGPVDAKTFDYIVYPVGGPPCLVEVKGRKAASRSATEECRSNNWVTIGDVHGLQTWSSVFGPDYRAAFVFCYWLACLPATCAGENVHDVSLAGRSYRFYHVPLDDYAKHQQVRSQRWKTLSVPTQRFMQLTRPLSECWPTAPC
jgi:hypothetical protein